MRHLRRPRPMERMTLEELDRILARLRIPIAVHLHLQREAVRPILRQAKMVLGPHEGNVSRVRARAVVEHKVRLL